MGPLLWQTQYRIGGKAPLTATPAVASNTLYADGAKARLNGGKVAFAPTAEFVLTVRTQRRGGVGLLLSRLLQHLSKHFLAAAQQFFFQVAEILIRSTGRIVHPLG